MSTLTKCNAMLTMLERTNIEFAALAAHKGRHIEAERCRKCAGYGSLNFPTPSN